MPAGVVGEVLNMAGFALQDMASESGCAADLDGVDGGSDDGGHALSELGHEGGPEGLDDASDRRLDRALLQDDEDLVP